MSFDENSSLYIPSDNSVNIGNREEKTCLFCPKLTNFASTAEMLNKALFLKYSSSQNYYYTKDIQDFMDSNRHSHVIKFNDLLLLNTKDELLTRFYKNSENKAKVTYLTEYYKYHREVPRLFMLPVANVINNFHDKKRRIEYYKIKKMLAEQKKGVVVTGGRDTSPPSSHRHDDSEKSSSFSINQKLDTHILPPCINDPSEHSMTIKEMNSYLNILIPPCSPLIHRKSGKREDTLLPTEMTDFLQSESYIEINQPPIFQTNAIPAPNININIFFEGNKKENLSKKIIVKSPEKKEPELKIESNFSPSKKNDFLSGEKERPELRKAILSESLQRTKSHSLSKQELYRNALFFSKLLDNKQIAGKNGSSLQKSKGEKFIKINNKKSTSLSIPNGIKINSSRNNLQQSGNISQPNEISKNSNSKSFSEKVFGGHRRTVSSVLGQRNPPPAPIKKANFEINTAKNKFSNEIKNGMFFKKKTNNFMNTNGFMSVSHHMKMPSQPVFLNSAIKFDNLMSPKERDIHNTQSLLSKTSEKNKKLPNNNSNIVLSRNQVNHQIKNFNNINIQITNLIQDSQRNSKSKPSDENLFSKKTNVNIFDKKSPEPRNNLIRKEAVKETNPFKKKIIDPKTESIYSKFSSKLTNPTSRTFFNKLNY